MSILKKISRGDKRSKAGFAIFVELLLAMMLMLSVLFFIAFMGRYLSERNRTLAASRTLAWIYAHKAPGEGEGTDPLGGDMHSLFRTWHFKDSGPAAGVVVLPEPREGSGLIFNDSDSEDKMDRIARRLTEGDGPNQDGFNVEVEDEPGGESVFDLLGMVSEALVVGFINFLSSEFRYVEARVDYGMPLVFPVELYRLFWGGTFSGSGNSGGGGVNQDMYREGETYMFISASKTGTTVFPVLNASTKQAFEGLTDTLASLMEKLQGFMKRDAQLPIFRPHTLTDETISFLGGLVDARDTRGDVTAERLEAIMVYEINGYDPRQNYAMEESE